MQYLLIARFTMDDIPLRLYGSYGRDTAEDDAKELHADPTLLDTKWRRSVDKWPLTPRGDFVGAIVLSISELDGYPSKVRFDSTAEPVPAPPEPATATPPTTATPLSAETDERAILREASEILVKQQIALTNDIEILRKSNAELLAENNTLVATRTQLHKTISEMLEERSQRVAELESQIGFLNDRNAALVSKNEELQQNSAAYSRKNDELRALNQDLNHRLNATKARADRATDLEGNLRGTAQHLLAHFQRLEERAKWAFRFADEEMMPLPYARAMLHCQRKFAEEFQGFLHMYPHVLPDIPAEYHPMDDTDDEMND